MITAATAAKVKELVSPGIYLRVQGGMEMKIVPTQRVDWPPPYKDATEKYSAQVRLSKDRRSTIGYVAGQPFPLIDPNDPDVAVKIAWNNVFRPITSDDYDLRFFECNAHYISRGKGTSLELDDTEVGHYAGYSEVGRTEVEPMPVDPDFKSTGRLWLFALYPVIQPATQRGAGIVRFRYADPKRGDDSWSYTVGARRVRRLNEAILSDATGISAWNPDHYSGFNPKTEAYDYKFLGEKQMLACVHAEHSPEIPCPTDGGASACPEAWEYRHMYVLEAKPRYGIVNTLQGRNMLYMDSESLVRALCRHLRSERRALPELHVPADRARSPGARRQNSDLPVQAFVRGRRVVARLPVAAIQHVLPARTRDAGARVLVHQYGCGG